MTHALLALAVLVAAPAAKDAPKKDPPALVGEWAVESTVENGKPTDPPAGATWAFTADRKSVLTVKGIVEFEITYEADPKRTPSWLDMPDWPSGKGARGIYKVEKDTLTLCLVEEDQERPTAFGSPAGSKILLVTLTRVKPEK
jgi:uncharacterized protein (TIGR03067 family)